MKFGARAVLLALLASIAAAGASASSLQTLYQFTGPEGGEATGGVIVGPSGTLYGETADGGTAPCTSKHGLTKEGCDTVYSLSASGVLTVLASFHGANGAYGTSGLTLIGTTLLGATINGGASDDGVIYAVKTNGTGFTLVHQFSGTDGYQPIGPLVAGKGGVYYGITSGGGANYPRQSPGVLFSLTSSGVFNLLYTFSLANGENPTTLFASPSGTLIGSTFNGGPTNKDYCPQGCGVVFPFNPNNRQYTVLQTYDGVSSGNPFVGSVGTDGTIHGNDGNLFSISPAGVYQVLGESNFYTGDQQESGPALAPNGSLFGTYAANADGNSGTGSLYSYQNGVFAVAGYLAYPGAEPIVTSSGAVIGTTNYGGACATCGTIYQYTP